MRSYLAGFLLLLLPSLAFAQARGEVESIGFQGLYRPGCWTPMVVKLVPTTGSVFTGREPGEAQLTRGCAGPTRLEWQLERGAPEQRRRQSNGDNRGSGAQQLAPRQHRPNRPRHARPSGRSVAIRQR